MSDVGRAAGRFSVDLRYVAFVFLVLLVAGCVNRPVRDSDKQLLVTVEELAPYGITYAKLAESEKFNRVYYFDFSKEIEYEYNSPEDVKGINPLVLSVTVGFERSRGEALKSYKIGLGALTLGTKLGGAKVEKVENFFKWGDESYFGVLKKGENIVGNLFMGRKGRKTYSFMLTGVYFSNPALVNELLLPHLTYLETYDG